MPGLLEHAARRAQPPDAQPAAERPEVVALTMGLLSNSGVADLVVKTAAPALLGDTLNALPMVSAVVAPDFDGSHVTVRITGDVGFAEYAIREQGYGEVVSTVPVT